MPDRSVGDRGVGDRGVGDRHRLRPGGIVRAVTDARAGSWAGLLGAVALAGATLLTWWLWLGTDTRYETDPVTGAQTGPYQPAQVIGCVLTLAVLAAVGGLVLRPWIVVVTMTVVFTLAWSIAASRDDDTGLWAVGAVLVAFGMAAGSALFGFGAWLLRTALHRRSA